MISIIVLTIAFVSVSQCFAAPFSYGTRTYSQPDGKNIALEKIVDEFGEYYFSKQGLVVQNDAGYWCYARYEENNNFTNTLYRVGSEKENANALTDLHNYNAIQHATFLKKVHGINSISALPKGVGKTAISSAILDILLVSFTDVTGTYNYRGNYDSLLVNNTYSSSPNPNSYPTYGSMKNYFSDMSMGNFTLTGSVVNSDTTLVGGTTVINWIDLPYTKAQCDAMSDYTFENMVKSKATEQGVVLNGSHKLAIIYAGHQLYNHGALHSHAGAGLYVCGEMLNAQDMFMSIGTHCHEFAHVLGIWEDDYLEPYIYRYAMWGLMCWGLRCGTYGECPSPLTPDERNRLLWLTYTNVTDPQTVQFTFNTSYGFSNAACMVATNSPAYQKEKFILENRQVKEGTKWNRFIPCDSDKDGILVWCITTAGNQYLITADSLLDSLYNNMSGDAFRSGYKSYLTDFSTPKLGSPSGWYSNAQISDISASGSGITTTMTATLGNSRFGNLPENETWPKELVIILGGILPFHQEEH